MATIDGNLWEYNLARVIVVDVTDDYRLMQPPLPAECYPILKEIWLSCHELAERLPGMLLIDGYLYDWHETPSEQQKPWVVGVVDRTLLAPPSSV